MKKSFFILTFILLSQTSLLAQKTLNNYAYVIVPDQFSFQNSKDQYQLNSLTRFLLEKEGVKVFWDTEKIPQEYVMMDCAGLKLKMNKKSSMFRTKVDFSLSDCYNTIVFASAVGESSQKDYKKGYQESIRNAFKSFSDMNYNYTPLAATVVTPVVIEKVEAPLVTGALELSGSMLYVNDSNLVLALKKVNGGYIGNVKSSESIEFSAGELICKLFKTSLPNVFKAQWKNLDGNFVNTIAYFDKAEQLNIDFSAPTGISVMKFQKQ